MYICRSFSFGFFVVVTYLVISNGRVIDTVKEMVARQYLCQDEQIKDKNECLKIMAQPALKQSYNFLMKQISNNRFLKRKGSPQASLYQSINDISFTYVVGGNNFSPYVLTENKDHTRIPQIIYRARCLHTQCINPITHQPIGSLDSKIVENEILVYIMSSNGSFENTRIKWSVGCTCIIPKSYPIWS